MTHYENHRYSRAMHNSPALNTNVNNSDKIIIAGGGMTALFTAYEILRQAQHTGKKMDVVVLAERFNVPGTAGNHIVLGLEGLYHEKAPIDNHAEIYAMMRRSLKNLERMIAQKKINCRYSLSYEIKAAQKEILHKNLDNMIEKGLYTANSINMNSENQIFNLPGCAYSASLDCIGQLNMPELLGALITHIKNTGGQILEGVRYESQEKNKDGTYTIRTSHGDYHTNSKPFLATGAEHHKSLPKVAAAKCKIIYTMAIVIGPLSQEDSAKISAAPMAMVQIDSGDDILWGGLDEQNLLTIGRGDTEDGSNENRERIRIRIMNQIENLYPGLSEKYPAVVSFGPMLSPSNGMPIVGRMENYDVAGGWGGFGIVAGYGAAQAYADWIVNGNDEQLKIFESMHPEIFQVSSRGP